MKTGKYRHVLPNKYFAQNDFKRRGHISSHIHVSHGISSDILVLISGSLTWPDGVFFGERHTSNTDSMVPQLSDRYSLVSLVPYCFAFDWRTAEVQFRVTLPFSGQCPPTGNCQAGSSKYEILATHCLRMTASWFYLCACSVFCNWSYIQTPPRSILAPATKDNGRWSGPRAGKFISK